MATITVLTFSDPKGAADALRAVQDLEKDHFIRLIDAAMVSWPIGKKSPEEKQLVTPFLAMTIRAAFGGLGTIGGYGLDAGFFAQIRRGLREGSSALFLMTADAALDRVADAMKALTFEIFATNLSVEQERKLRTALGEMTPAHQPR
jgi:uncharacterized membrane protein